MAADSRAERFAYSDPQPYDNPDLERELIAGRIKYQRFSKRLHEEAGDVARSVRAQRIIDRLLDRYNAADEFAALATTDNPEATDGG
jgi:hypothetical protein